MNLTVDQIRIVMQNNTGQSLIKGVAGSGKTTVALYKLVQMQQQKMSAEDKILIVTYNKTLIRYMKYLSEKYGLYIDSKYSDIRTIDSIIWRLYEKTYGRPRIASQNQQRAIMQKAIQQNRLKYPDNIILSEKKLPFLQEEIDWMKSCNYLSREEYLNVDRLGRGSIGENRLRLAKQSKEREAIYDTFLLYEKYMSEKGMQDYKSMAICVLQQIEAGNICPPKYNYIIVDESQDLTRIQLEIIHYLYLDTPKSNIIFISDVAQSIYTQSWLSKNSFKSVGFDMSGRSNILSKNFRTTRQIGEAAYALLQQDEELKKNVDFVQPVSLERNGPKPSYRHFEDVEKEFFYITNEIKKCVAYFELRDIVVVARNSNYLNSIKDYFDKNGIDSVLGKQVAEKDLFGTDKIKLFTMHSVKGLEASVVFLAGLNEEMLPARQDLMEEDRKLLYVGMTRAKEKLFLSSSVKACCYLKEIPKKLLQTEGERASLYDVSVDEYQFLDRLANICGKEEKVRQWFLEELQIKYGYPKDLIAVEERIQCGSRPFYVDIIVYSDKQKTSPLIYIETKQPGEDMEAALSQVKSYIVPGNAPRYLVVTDGEKQFIQKIENGEYKQIQEIPYYDAFRPDAWNYTYYNLSNLTEFTYRRTPHEKDSLIDAENGMQCSSVSIPVMGSVAAGNLQFADEIYDHSESVPEALIHDAESKFFLQVSGDSMVDFQIQDGDYLLIQRQALAPNGSVIVGGRRSMNEATVKQYYYDGKGKVTLHPGNPKYEDIIIDATDFYMNGVAVGILRRTDDHVK